MKLIYRAKWIIVVLFAIMFFFSFAVLFAGGTTKINWCLLVANILLIFAQTANVVFAFMNKHKKTGIALLVFLLMSIGFVLVVGLIIVASYLMGYKVARRDQVLEYRDKIIERIDSFRAANGHLPELMSEVGFRQTGGGEYYYKGIRFDYIKSNDNEYIVEYISEDGVLTQYHDHCWTEEPDICLIEMPVNADTIAAINKISKFEQDYNVPPLIDSISFNQLRICPIGDYTGQPDSIAYIRYLYKDGSLRCEGWVAYFDDPEDDFSNPFGEWKYYDQEGNCYRKFWNYKENNKPFISLYSR